LSLFAARFRAAIFPTEPGRGWCLVAKPNLWQLASTLLRRFLDVIFLETA